MFKRILIVIFTFLIALSGFLTGFFSVGCMSVYAAVNDDSIYVPLREQSDLVTAFQSYCKSRDLTIEGSLTDAVTTFTTGAFNSACNEIGINISQLQAEIKAEYDSSGKPVKFLFNDTGIMAMNRIFAQFLQDNELEVGDTDVNENVYSGYLFTDDNGNSCNVTMIGSATTTYDGFSYWRKSTGQIRSVGTPFIYTGSQLMNNGLNNLSFVKNGRTYTFNFYRASNIVSLINEFGYSYQIKSLYSPRSTDGFLTIFYSTNDGQFYYGSITSVLTADTPPQVGYGGRMFGPIQGEISTNNVNIFIVSNEINNNTYEGDTIINNEGDIINNPTPNNPNDTIHNVPETPLSPNDDGGWDIDLPDIDIPNLPIGNLSEKFPFSIPWDLVAFYAMLDAEPEAPRFNGTMDLTLVQWNYDIDLSPFDSAAELCRKLQFGLFVVGLIVASRSIIRG